MSVSDQSARLAAPTGPLTRHRFSVLLGTLLILLVAAALVHESGPARHPRLAGLIITIVFAVMLLAAVFAVSTSRRWFIVAVSSVAPVILLQIIGLFVEGQAVEIAKYCAPSSQTMCGIHNQISSPRFSIARHGGAMKLPSMRS